MAYSLPQEVREIVEGLHREGYGAYPVGGCVRDLVIGRAPKDWDVTTDATPEEVQKIFPESVYENEFGTVGVKTGSDDATLTIVEVTTFRKEGRYSDKRHPDEVTFAKTIDDDLSRRDFTVNALALNVAEEQEVIDPYGGRRDLKNKVIRAVGNPAERFKEDALRLVRAPRLVTELGIAEGWHIEDKTYAAIREHASLLREIAVERVRDELVRLMLGQDAAQGLRLLEELGLLQYIMPEVREGIGIDQAKHHTFTVWEHGIRSLQYAAERGFSLTVRMSALLHDVGKPRTKAGEGEAATFYNHEIVGARMTRELLTRLAFPKQFVQDVAHLVRYHLFYYNVGEVTEAGVRRFVRRAGVEYIDDLLRLREADRIGSGVPKAFPYKLRHLLYMIEKVRRDPLSVKALAVDGEAVMKTVGLVPGPRVGWILNALMEEVLDAPEKNTEELLTKRMKALAKLSDEELQEKGEKGKRQMEEFERGVEAEIKGKYRVG
ncbi:hypothetical protein A2110_01555 [Candidatus Jorgensenbacteria bacterium GWA1_54_12]|uniref:HD domain-containing protein n=1 Tax=Candidatus Jorgensenbacteria bacterium GWA1_54_12 TaxID=1798468 RepID=A0A1F6BLC9_9BACT|nr:MAG: hypothetical protein A2110_01555 [Candidatus Jorgensenbacteria bacterium GWA1_54_12]